MLNSKNNEILPNGKDPEWAWRSLLGILKNWLSGSQYSRWIRPAVLIGYKDGSFIVALPDRYYVEWWENRLSKLICRQLVGIINGPAQIRYEIRGDLQDDQLQLPDLDPGPGPMETPRVKFKRI